MQTHMHTQGLVVWLKAEVPKDYWSVSPYILVQVRIHSVKHYFIIF